MILRLNTQNAGTIVEICKRLDCLPLAIELAVPRLKILSPRALLARLEYRLQILTTGGLDLPVRQQTMYNTIQWSYDLLTFDEQRLFRCLSVFVGEYSLESAEILCTLLDDMTTSVLDDVSSLLDKSLLRVREQQDGEVHLIMLETIREFGLECLAANTELRLVRDAHATCYYKRIQKIQLSAVNTMYASLEPEYENIMSALQWLLEESEVTGRVNMALSLVRVVGRLAVLRGQVNVGYDFLQKVLTMSRKSTTPISPTIRTEALYITGWLAFWQSEYKQAVPLLEEALTLFRSMSHHTGIVFSLNMLGTIASEQGDFDRGNMLFAECLQLSKEKGLSLSVSQVLAAEGRQSITLSTKTNAVFPNSHLLSHQEAAKCKHRTPDLLTAREIEVLTLLAAGLKNSQIAKQLVISPNTVGIHVQSIYGKLGVSSRSEATRYAVEQHLV